MLRCEAVSADLSTFVPGRRLDDDVRAMLRFEGGARGALWCSQVSLGHENGLRLRLFGEAGGLEWAQTEPNVLRHAQLGRAPRLLTRAGPELSVDAQPASRRGIPKVT